MSSLTADQNIVTAPTMYTASEVANLLRVSPRTIRRWRQLGLLASVDVAGTRVFRFTPADVRALLVRHSRP
jgi:excisionase family DNA binding protein